MSEDEHYLTDTTLLDSDWTSAESSEASEDDTPQSPKSPESPEFPRDLDTSTSSTSTNTSTSTSTEPKKEAELGNKTEGRGEIKRKEENLEGGALSEIMTVKRREDDDLVDCYEDDERDYSL